MQDNLLTYSDVGMIVLLVLTCYVGIKIINKLFDENKKKKSSIF